MAAIVVAGVKRADLQTYLRRRTKKGIAWRAVLSGPMCSDSAIVWIVRPVPIVRLTSAGADPNVDSDGMSFFERRVLL